MKHVMWLALLAVSSQSFAIDTAGPRVVASFEGEIRPDTVDRFLEKYGNRKDLTEFSIDSQGGDVKAALKLARWIQANGLDVRVRSVCYSACANYIFIAGKKKILNSGAFVAWHGDAYQKDIREFVAEFRKVLDKLKIEQKISVEDRAYLQDNHLKFINLTRLQREQSEFYKLVGVDPMMGRFGQEPINYPSDGWSFTLPAMKLLGIQNVVADEDYGSNRYFGRTSPTAMIMNKGPLLVFHTKDGTNITPINPLEN